MIVKTPDAPPKARDPIKQPRKFTEDEASPLSLPWIHILLALADGARHGYGIMREVDERSGGEVNIWPATLYGAIKRMLAAGLIDESRERPDEGDNAQRRYYELTATGRRVLAQETARLARLVQVAAEKNVSGEPT